EADVALSTAHPDTDWMGASIWGAITRSTDGGRRNIQADAGIDKTGSAFVAPVRKCPADDDVFVTGTNRMWRTNNFFSSTAPSWVANGPPSAFPYPFPNALDYPGTIHEIEFSALDRVCNTYAYGTRGGQVKLTRNGGTTWTDLDSSKSPPPRPVNGLAFDGAN